MSKKHREHSSMPQVYRRPVGPMIVQATWAKPTGKVTLIKKENAK